jgi:hypothetical protein
MIEFYIIILFLLFILFYVVYKYNNLSDYVSNCNEILNIGIYTAVIVEPREHKAFEFVLDNFLENLSNEWNFIIFHGNKNEQFVNNLINNKFSQYKNRITLINLNVDNLTIRDYNKLLVSKEFYEKIPTEIILIFQTDTIICENNKLLINNYLQYDYVGAPWIHLKMMVGNGGLSLRRKSKMIEIIDKCPYKKDLNEDLFFSKNCENVYVNIPISDDAKHFSVETIYEKDSFGVHKPWRQLGDNLNKKIKECKGLDTLIKLNKLNLYKN